jgi:CheY-like chemotaxis protein
LDAFSDMLAFHFPNVRVTAVDSGATALAAATGPEYDLVICDLLMPGMDGAQTLAALRANHPHLRMYLMTGHPEPQKVYKTTQATGFIKKPLDRAYFLEFMHRTIHVISVGKRATATVTWVTQHLASVFPNPRA